MSAAGTCVEVTRSEGLSFAVTSSTVRGARYETVVFKATFEFGAYGPPRPVAADPVVLWDVPRIADVRSSLASGNEAVPFMPNAAVLLSGFAHAPKATPHGPFRVRLALYSSGKPIVDKHLHVVTETGAPVPLIYEEALARPENPAGTPRPRITDPRQPDMATGVGPIAASWPQRAQLLRGAAPSKLADGVVDLGAGVDGRFFNPAPLDQQVRQIDGTETLLLEGVDPEVPRWTTHLGGASATASFAVGSAAPKPVRLALDMVVIDAARRRFSLVWRALLPVSVDDVTRAGVRVEGALHHAGAARSRVSDIPPAAEAARPRGSLGDTTGEMLAAPRSPALPFAPAPGRADFVARPTPSPQPIVAPPAVPARAPSEIPPPRQRSKLEQTLEPIDSGKLAAAIPFAGAPVRTGERGATREAQAAIPATPYEQAYASKEVVPAGGVQSTLIGAAAEELAMALARMTASAEPRDSAPLAVAPPPLVQAPLLELNAATGLGVAPLPATPPEPQPRSIDDRGDPRRASIIARLASGMALRDMDLAGADLSDLDLTKQSLTGSKLDTARLTNTILRGANLAGISAAGANLEGAMLADADLTGANLTGAVMNGASLAGATLIRADLSKAHARGADLSSAKLEAAVLVQLDAERANFTGADLARANAERGMFTDANLERVSAMEANFERASLVRARLTGATLTGARLGKASLDEAKVDGADLEGADLAQSAGPDARFDGTNLARANFRQARLENASFTKARLTGANLNRADLSRAGFDDADLTGADVRGARLVQASLRRTTVHETDFRDGDLTGAIVDGTDLSKAKMKGAKPPKAT